jgi:hypothetical protein
MAELEDNLKLTPEERLEKNDIKLAAHFKREAFLNCLQRGWNLIRSRHAGKTHE